MHFIPFMVQKRTPFNPKGVLSCTSPCRSGAEEASGWRLLFHQYIVQTVCKMLNDVMATCITLSITNPRGLRAVPKHTSEPSLLVSSDSLSHWL